MDAIQAECMLTELVETMGLAWVLAQIAADLIEREAREQHEHVCRRLAGLEV